MNIDFNDWEEVLNMNPPRNWVRVLTSDKKNFIALTGIIGDMNKHIGYEIMFFGISTIADKYFSIYPESKSTKIRLGLVRCSEDIFTNVEDAKLHIDEFLDKLNKLQVYF